MRRIFGATGRFAVRWRWLIVAVWVIGAVAAVKGLPSLSSVAQGNNTVLLPANSPSMQAQRLAAPLQGDHLVPVTVIAVRKGKPLSATDDAALATMAAKLKAVPGVARLVPLGLSSDREAALVDLGTNVSMFDNQGQKTLINRLEAAISAARLPTGLHAYVTGQIATGVANDNANRHVQGRIQSLSMLFILVLLLLVFRSLLAPVLTLLPAGLVAATAGPIVAEAAKAGLPVSAMTQFMMIVIVLGAGTDYGLFLVFRVREELQGGLDKHAAVVRAVERVGESITFSAATVIAAFLSLLAATFGVYQSLGPSLAIAIALMLLAGLTLTPALLAIFGRAAFWPSRKAASLESPGAWGKVAGSVVRRPVLTLVVGVVVLGGIALASLSNRPAGFGGEVSAPAGSQAALGQAALIAHYPAAAANPTNLVMRFPGSVWSDPESIARAQASLEGSHLFRSLLGPLDPNGARLAPGELSTLHTELGPALRLGPLPPAGISVSSSQYNAYRATAELVSTDGRTIQFEATLRAGSPTSTPALQAVPAVRAALGRAGAAAGAVATGVGGESAGFYDVSNVSNHDLLHVVPLAIIAIALLLGLVMRSLVAPWYLVASVALSYASALGVAVLVFVDIGGAGGLTFILPFLLFLFLLALGEDYNILVLTRIREEARRVPLADAVRQAVGVSGTTVTSAGLVLAGTFTVLAIAGGAASGGSEIRDIGFGLAIGILMDTFIVRTLLVPSACVLLGRWNWWPSGLFHRTFEQTGDGLGRSHGEGEVTPGGGPGGPGEDEHDGGNGEDGHDGEAGGREARDGRVAVLDA